MEMVLAPNWFQSFLVSNGKPAYLHIVMAEITAPKYK